MTLRLVIRLEMTSGLAGGMAALEPGRRDEVGGERAPRELRWGVCCCWWW